MFRAVRLQDHVALFTRPTGATGNPGYTAGRSVCGAEIGGEQRAVDVQQRDQRDVGKWCPFASI
ncbi:hypothetical protein ACNKHO_25190 [Shigella flexneri]